jgi:hypothetical protein
VPPLAAIQVRGLREFRDALRDTDQQWPKALRKAHKNIADMTSAWARSGAASGTKMQAAASRSIVGTATQTSASMAITAGTRTPFANIAFWGAKRHAGWYADPKYATSPRQFAPWVGNSWDVGVIGQGPYVLNATIATHMDAIVDEFGKAIDELAHQAFPN